MNRLTADNDKQEQGNDEIKQSNLHAELYVLLINVLNIANILQQMFWRK